MKKFLLFIATVICSSGYSQTEVDPYKFTSVVDLYEFPTIDATGNLDASLPLYTIKTKGFELPLTLNYDQMGNTNVFYIGNQFGDAWVLNAGGTISRECKDRPTPIYISGTASTSCGTSYTFESYTFESLQNDEYYYSINPSATSRSNPDIYTFSVMGLTGKFIINREGSQYKAKLIETSDFAKVTVNGGPGGDNYNFLSISITDKNGYKYIFSAPSTISTNNGNKRVIAKSASPLPPGCTYGGGANSPVFGHEIVDNNGNSGGGGSGGAVSNQIIAGKSKFWENLELSEIYDKDNNLLISYQYDTTGFVSPGGTEWVNGIATIQAHQKLFLKQIDIKGQGSINFINSLGTNTGNVVNSYTNSVEIKDLTNNLIKKFAFTYLVKSIHNIKHIKDYKDGSYGLSFHKRLLTGIKEYDNTSQKYLNTTVEYKDLAITNTNVVVDRYGFLTKVGYCSPNLHISLNDYKANAFILQKIKYPTGGSVVYEFEPHTFSHSLLQTDFRDFNYDNHIYTELSLSKSANTATFTANAGDTIYVLNPNPNYSLSLYKKVSGVDQLVKSGFVSKDGQSTLTADDCKHLYTSVVLPASQNNQYVFKYSSTVASTSGLKVYRFHYSDTYYNFRYAEGNRIAKIAYFENNVSKNILNTPAGETTAEKVISFDYSDQSEANTSSGRVRTPSNGSPQMRPLNVIYDQVTTTIKGVGKQFSKYDIPYNSNWSDYRRTDVKESKVYDLSNKLVSQNIYDYVYKTMEFTTTPYLGVDDVKQFIKSSSVTTRNYESDAFMTATQSTVYDETLRQPLSQSSEDALGKTTKTDFTYQNINNVIVNTQTDHFINGSLAGQTQNVFDTAANLSKTAFKTPEMNAYETTGNENTRYSNGLLTGYTQPDGTKVTLVYGYNNIQLVAKLLNVDANVFYSNSSYTTLRNNITNYSNQNNIGYSEANLKTTLNSLRTTFPNALVTTYTYKPMVGVSSITDENGKETTYEYDSFNRLATVKDYLGNILKEYRYNFTN